MSRPTRTFGQFQGVAAILGTLTVCAAGFWASWHGLTKLGSVHGLAGLAAVLPLALDGLVLSSTMVILSRGRLGRKAGRSWAITLFGAGLSGAGNAVASLPHQWAWLTPVIWGLLPLLMAISFHQLMEHVTLHLGGTDPNTDHPVALDVRTTVRAQAVPAAPAVRATATLTARSTRSGSQPEMVDGPTRGRAAVRAPGSKEQSSDLAAVVRGVCARWYAESGRIATPADWREILADAPELASYSRPDKAIPARVIGWARTQGIPDAAGPDIRTPADALGTEVSDGSVTGPR